MEEVKETRVPPTIIDVPLKGEILETLSPPPLYDRVCINCRYGAITTSPTMSPEVGGFTSGVYCHSKAKALELDEQTRGTQYATWDYMDEYKTCGFLYLWRLECVASGTNCPHFKDRVNVDERVQGGK